MDYRIDDEEVDTVQDDLDSYSLSVIEYEEDELFRSFDPSDDDDYLYCLAHPEAVKERPVEL